MNTSMAENFMRSANAPVISAGVMIAKVSWNIEYTDSGMVVARCETLSLLASFMKVMPCMRKREAPPRYAVPPGVKAHE